MKTLLQTLIVLTVILISVPVQGQKLKAQKKYLPGCIKEMKIYLGMSKNDLLRQCPDCKIESDNSFASFRTVYNSPLEDDVFSHAVFYVSTTNNDFYEMILIAKDNQNATAYSEKLLGQANAANKEWRFYADDTGEPFTIAAWNYMNKLILAASVDGSEWDEGFDQ